MPRAYYAASLADFLAEPPEHVLGKLAAHPQPELEALQRQAWQSEIDLLRLAMADVPAGYLLLEYTIPRMGKRVDVVLLLGGVVVVLEFKIGEAAYTAAALEQALDYALDLKYFHQQSHTAPIIPVVVATEAPVVPSTLTAYEDGVYAPVRANRHNLRQVVETIQDTLSAPAIDPAAWRDSVYRPTPTIVEAAQALYRNHSVEEIARSDAEAANLGITSAAIIGLVEAAKAHQRKAICFVTGVPGAGKTLAGLNIATERMRTAEDEHAVFLSGNGPLVEVLREALARNERATTGRTLQAARTRVRTFIQNIHHFRDDALTSAGAPIERVAVFDEAQRAWTREETARFMKERHGLVDFAMSEPHFLISVMDRHADWAVIVCLVGGGQEINRGEAGLPEWLNSLSQHFPHWHVFVSPNLSAAEYLQGHSPSGLIPQDRLHIDPRLHLAVSLRSFRAETVSDLVKAILDNDPDRARGLYQALRQRYPIVLTRDLEAARAWLRQQARGSERIGLLASSGAHRLRPIGVNVRAKVDVINWFLNGKDDVRSSYFLEEVATEFDVQGLELDWAGVIWDADLRYDDGQWQFKNFSGTTWKNVNDLSRVRYLKNAYRVLLTRARQGLVIVVPEGNPADATRLPSFYDGTYAVLRDVGLATLATAP